MGNSIKSFLVLLHPIFFLIVGGGYSLSGCAGKSATSIPVAEQWSHLQLERMQTTPVHTKVGTTFFGESRTYFKRGIQIVVLHGSPYELGYSRGVLLKSQIHQWVSASLAMIKKRFLGTTIGITMMNKRALDVEQYIFEEYKTELRGLAAGSGVKYETLFMLNVLETIGRSYGCTSVAVRDMKGQLLRSRNLDYQDLAFLKPFILFLYKPEQGYAFASLSAPGVVGVMTAMNEKGLTYGTHDIYASSKAWRGTPLGIMNRQIIQNAATPEAAGKTLTDSNRCLPGLLMVTNSDNAIIYEFDSKRVGHTDLENEHLILTNHTRKLALGRKNASSLNRFSEAEYFLAKNPPGTDLQELVELNRGRQISWAYNRQWHNLHSVIFRPATLDLWVAIDPPPATRGKWIGFNLKKELNGQGKEPDPAVIPAVSN